MTPSRRLPGDPIWTSTIRCAVLPDGRTLLEVGEREEAFVWLDRAIDRGDDDPELELQRGEALRLLGCFALAAAPLERGVGLGGQLLQLRLQPAHDVAVDLADPRLRQAHDVADLTHR